MREFARLALFAGGLPLLGCVVVTSSDDTETQSSGSGSSSSSATSAESSSEEGSGDTSAEASCADYLDEESCNAAPGDEPGCAWATGHLASREGDACTMTEQGICIRGDYGDTAAGCGSASGCEADASPYTNPYYLEVAGGLMLLDFCGGSPPAEFTPCGSGEAATADPAACACACELFPALMP